ncbi:MAG: hypothetical protein CMH50_07860 [Myxococcales bacterium]|nr:hypothetical protein [Myxococcales bacterium]
MHDHQKDSTDSRPMVNWRGRGAMNTIEITYYLDYLPKSLLQQLWLESEGVETVDGLRVARGLRAQFPSVASDEALGFIVDLYKATSPHLQQVLKQRLIDRVFVDDITQRCAEENRDTDFLAPDYSTVVGQKDAQGRVVVGPHPDPNKATSRPVEVPEYLLGDQVTLFGPPDTARMSINAMNTLHRKLPNEPSIVAELVRDSGQVPRWGADNEDSKTPIMANLLAANENLIGCFNHTLRYEDPNTEKVYELAETGLSKPIKRIPGLALPDGNHLLDGQPLPLHLVDFGLHLFHNWRRPEALVFYVPKLENEEEAEYLKHFITTAESLLKAVHPDYTLGSVKLFIVFESPRSIFRIREMADALHPHFVGGSLGWHDFLGSTARLFRHDPNYRIPVKADPNIVINHIRESHQILVDSLKPIGGIRIGGMYGVLYEDGNPASFEVSMVGFMKDVFTQLKRQLDGFWVAHPSFVRIGIAMMEAWRQHQADPNNSALERLVKGLVPNPNEHRPLLDFITGPDVSGLERDDPLYHRGVLAADLPGSDVIANHDPREVRYNIFQALQYLADWLSGNGCVALPAVLQNQSGEDVFVRIMDDLATTERSRWELWAEIFHGRVSRDDFESILAQEVDFIRHDRSTPTKRVQVRWDDTTAQWYPIAIQLLQQLVYDPNPVEFATELLLPFTFDVVRTSDDPWATAQKICPGKYKFFDQVD